MYITKNAAEGVEEGDIINCVIMRTLDKKKKKRFYYFPVIVGRVGNIIGFDMRHFISIAVWKKMHNIEESKKAYSLGKLEDIKKSVSDVINGIDFDIQKFIGTKNSFDNAFDTSIDALFPLFVRDNDILYHNHPAMISHVAMFYPNALDNKDVWLQIARLADLVLVDYNKWDTAAKMALRMSDVFAETQTKPEFKTINASHLLKSMPRIITRIVYSRIFSQHWKHWV